MAARRDRMLFAPGRKRRPGCLISLLMLLAIIGLAIGLNATNNRYVSLVPQRVTILDMNSSLQGFKVLHVSDLHGLQFGRQQERLRSLLRLETYKAVALTGDLVGKDGDVQPLLDMLAVFPQDVPVYFVAGDEDPPPLVTTAREGQSAKAAWVQAAEAAGAIWLDRPQKITEGRGTLWFLPASLYATDLAQARFALQTRRTELQTTPEGTTPDGAMRLLAVEQQLEALDATDTSRKEMRPQDTYILLSHLPPDAETVASMHAGEGSERSAVNFPGSAALLLAGHWNDGQWRLPLLGPIAPPPAARALMPWMDNDDLSGMGSIHGMQLHVSPGLGASVVYPWRPFRLNNRPRVSLLTLTQNF